MLDEFFQFAIDLKNIERKGWKNKLGIKNPESVAEHSYSMALMCMVAADLQGLNTKKVMKMSLLHDLAESLIGDLTPEEIDKEEKTHLENNTMQKILTKLPMNLADEYMAIWQEYQSKRTEESKLTHEIDRLEMAFQAKTYLKEGYPKEKIQAFIDTARKEINNKQLKEILEKLLQ